MFLKNKYWLGNTFILVKILYYLIRRPKPMDPIIYSEIQNSIRSYPLTLKQYSEFKIMAVCIIDLGVWEWSFIVSMKKCFVLFFSISSFFCPLEDRNALGKKVAQASHRSFPFLLRHVKIFICQLSWTLKAQKVTWTCQSTSTHTVLRPNCAYYFPSVS